MKSWRCDIKLKIICITTAEAIRSGKEDIKYEKKDSYNPLRYLDTEDEQEYETLCRLMMTSMISECAKSFERLPILLHADILRNILYSGVWSKYEYIQLKKKRKKS